MIFGFSRGVPTVPFGEVKKFLRHIDKDLKSCLFLAQLEKVLIFRHRHFFVTDRGVPKESAHFSSQTLAGSHDRVLIFRHRHFFFTDGGFP